MSEKTEIIVLPQDDAAACVKTVTGWVSRTGRFWGDDERMARFDGSTHKRCDIHGTLHASNSYCKECHAARQLAKFKAMPREEWDGAAMLYDENSETFFTDADALRDHIHDNATEGSDAAFLAGMRLVICEPEFPAQIDPWEHYTDSLPEDSDPPAAVIEAFEVLNKALRACAEPLCWWPGKKAAIVTPEQIGLDDQEQDQQAPETMWCIRIPGPDDVHAMASKEAAEKAKLEHDAAISKWYENPTVDKRFLPLLENMLAVVEPWPYDTASHAEDLAQQAKRG